VSHVQLSFSAGLTGLPHVPSEGRGLPSPIVGL
jgi:hypothetical protein